MLSPSKTNDGILGRTIFPIPTSPTTTESSSSSSSASVSASSLGQSQNLPPPPPVETTNGSKRQLNRNSFRFFLLFLLVSVVTATAALAIVLAVRLAHNDKNPNIADSTSNVQGPYPSDRLSPTLAPIKMVTPVPSAGVLPGHQPAALPLLRRLL
jgi:hypothetical protein